MHKLTRQKRAQIIGMIVEGMSILDISGQLRDAYVRVASAAVRALATGA